ncbi:MAG: family 16 glycosylhydrolase, partial [Oscillospiraceae bacterium]|nr:family 16 glycosylhydrolase [Oscillospiraceae bacterium]
MKRRFLPALLAGMLTAQCIGIFPAAAADPVTALNDFLCGTGTLSADEAAAADKNCDGQLDARDLTLLLRKPAETADIVWQDEFDGDTLDLSKWSYELGNWKLDASGNYVTGGWGNNEQEFYTDKNTAVHDGILTIAARKEPYSDAVQGNYDYTSARLSTQHKFSTCGGRIEVRARCDAGKSLWPAIWMLPEDEAYGGWAASGEIDIMEGWGSTPEKICGTIHFGGQWPNNTYLTKDYAFPAGDSTGQWHTYAVEWESGEIRWYVDDTLYSTQSEWYSTNHAYPAPFDQKFYLILNLAVGGHFDGVDGIYTDPSIFADGDRRFEIDYVRVYDTAAFTPTTVTSLPLEAYIEGADASLVNKDGETVITVNDPGSLKYGVMGLIRGKEVRAGETHTLSFDVTSSAVRDMVVTAEDSAYTRYL